MDQDLEKEGVGRGEEGDAPRPRGAAQDRGLRLIAGRMITRKVVIPGCAALRSALLFIERIAAG
jgi:hypothetical protein